MFIVGRNNVKTLFFVHVKTYLRRDGKILVKLDKIMYGFKEAAYWWNKLLTKVFLDNGYQQMSKDQ